MQTVKRRVAKLEASLGPTEGRVYGVICGAHGDCEIKAFLAEHGIQLRAEDTLIKRVIIGRSDTGEAWAPSTSQPLKLCG